MASCGLRKAVIPAAGLGTRFLPATVAVPKEMLTLGDRPAIQWIVEEALAAGVEEIILVTSASKPAIRAHFEPRPELLRQVAAKGPSRTLDALEHLREIGTHLRFVEQQEQLGLGHAVLCAAPYVRDEPFLVLLGDALVRGPRPAAAQLADAWRETGGPTVIGLERVPVEKVQRYGIVAGTPIRDRLWRLSDLIEKPAPKDAPSDLAIAGRYILSPRVLDFLAEGQRGHGGEIQLTDALRRLVREEPVFGVQYEGERHDIGNALDYADAVLAYALDDPAARAKLLRRAAACTAPA